MKKKVLFPILALVLALGLAVPVAAADTINVPADYDTIQEAIDAASDGDIINVAADTYNEALLIDGTDLSLVAIGEVIINNPSPSSKTIAIYDSTCTIDGFTVQGGYLGIYARGMSSYGETAVDVTIINNYVKDYTKNGITVNGDLATGLVKDNNVETDPDAVYAQNGIQFGYGATGKALRNTVQADWYTGEDWTACGILVFESDEVSVKLNEVSECQTGIAVETWGWFCSSANNNKIVNNNVEGAEWAISVTAISWDGYSTMDAFANNNKVVNNVITADDGDNGDTGIYVGVYDNSDSYNPEADNNKVIRNNVSGYENNIVEEGTATKIHANIPVE